MNTVTTKIIGLVVFLGLVVGAFWYFANSEVTKTEPVHVDSPEAQPGDPPVAEPPVERIYYVQEENGEGVIYGADFDEATVQITNSQPYVYTGVPIEQTGELHLSPNKQFVVVELRSEMSDFAIWSLVTGEKIRFRVDGKTPRGLRLLAWSWDSQYVFAQVSRGIERGLWRINILEDTDHHLYDDITYSGLGMISAAITHDQSTIMYSFTRGLGQGSELWTMDWDGNNRQQMMTDAWSIVGGMQYSADESRITYIRQPDGATPFTLADIWVMNADGSNPVLISQSASGGRGFVPLWSPDNQTVAFVTMENPTDSSARRNSDELRHNIHLGNADTGDSWPLLPLTGEVNYYPSWSPSGKALVFISDQGGVADVWYIEQDGTGMQPVLTSGKPTAYPVWSVGFQLIFFPVAFQTVWRGNEHE